ncbi:MAG: agmatine deiminase family protein, partial [Dehalococcoidia bacterium]|nr:agmatine deiminase family protein [Dehalococcoidia bacterium]
MDRVRFFYYNFDTLWIRDYGPRSVIQNSNTPAIIDHKYNRTRPLDDAYPAFCATSAVPYPAVEPLYHFGGETDANSIIHGGGNLLNFSNGDGFSSSLIVGENPTRTQAQIVQSFHDYFNLTQTIFPKLLTTMDSTGHIDMWFMPVGNNKVVIGQFPTSNYPTSRTTTENAATAMAARGYTVYRTPSWSSSGNETGSGTHYTYTNIAIINKKVFVPTYNNPTNDNAALATYASAMPGHTIVPLDCSTVISLAGAIHCIMKHVYAPTPFGEALKPNGGETFGVGQTKQIKWIANDDVGITSVDLYYSTNGGTSWTTIATGEPHDGYYTWTVPSAESTQCRIRVVVHDGSGNTYEDVSNSNFTITSQLPVEFVAAGTAAAGTGTIQLALPSGIAAGDILLLAIETANEGASTITNQNGGAWTQVAGSPQSTGGTRLTVFWDRYNGTQGAPTVSDVGDHQIGRI